MGEQDNNEGFCGLCSGKGALWDLEEGHYSGIPKECYLGCRKNRQAQLR